MAAQANEHTETIQVIFGGMTARRERRHGDNGHRSQTIRHGDTDNGLLFVYLGSLEAFHPLF